MTDPVQAPNRASRRYLALILVPPLAAIIAGLYTVFLAYDNADTLVDDDYYRQGLAINQSLERLQHARELGLSASIRYQADSGEVAVTLTQASGKVADTALVLKLSHLTRQPLDQQVTLTPDAQGVFRGQLPVNLTGNWYLELSSIQNSWRLIQAKAAPLTAVQQLSP